LVAVKQDLIFTEITYSSCLVVLCAI